MPSRLQFVFWLDVTLLIAICALETVPFTGLVLHEWLGLAIVGMLVVHLLLSWSWIAASTRGLFTTDSNRTRANYALNLGLFACVTAVIYSGALISQEAIPVLTGTKVSEIAADVRWENVHDRFSNFVVILGGLHLAINWSWSLAAARKVLRRTA